MALPLGACVKLTPVEIPIAAWPGYEYFYLAQEQKLDRAQGLEIRTLSFPDSGAIASAYAQGRLAIAQITTVEAVDICSRVPKRCPVVVLALNESRGGDKVVVRPSIATIAGLRGRRVGLATNTLGPYVLSRALAQEGLELADVRIVPMPLEDMGRRLTSGEIDGVAFFPPFSDEVLASGKAVEVFNSAAIPGEIFDVLVVEPTWYRQNLDTLARLLRVWQDAHASARRDPGALDIMAAREGITADAFRRTEGGLVYTDLPAQKALLAPGGILARNLAAVLAVQKDLGVIEGPAPLPRVETEPIRRALE
ncbi:MAG: ABC transporter substrate-binding protein [Synechococcus sp.]|nr:ABC transporter substrate-binding protein [Synechococcus sp.]